MMETLRQEDVRVVPAAVLRQIICNPAEIPDEWKDMKMMSNHGDLLPVHLPNISDLVVLIALVKQLFFWMMNKLGEQDSLDVIPPEFACILDPPPVIPRIIETIELKYATVNIETRSWTNAMKLVPASSSEQQIQLNIFWESQQSLDLERPIKLYVVPRHYILVDPSNDEEREFIPSLTEDEVEVDPFPLPIHNMCILILCIFSTNQSLIPRCPRCHSGLLT
ncbi:uncharacterized protein LOC110694986 isoform X2 [Chenopodium quinoa]|uniref:uncharacterized protein LOC110694986 isoform X2 n=1 Tax=Chenopodium quinoa TaxID=63459 RepID=UPI000B76BC2F|nr:uncharacterized protein LOC110694986 isoform X2 [Chenopodium quinoa]